MAIIIDDYGTASQKLYYENQKTSILKRLWSEAEAESFINLWQMKLNTAGGLTNDTYNDLVTTIEGRLTTDSSTQPTIQTNPPVWGNLIPSDPQLPDLSKGLGVMLKEFYEKNKVIVIGVGVVVGAVMIFNVFSSIKSLRSK